MCGYHIRICQHNMMAANMFTIKCYITLWLHVYHLMLPDTGSGHHRNIETRADKTRADQSGCSYLKTDTRPSDVCPCVTLHYTRLQNTRGGECLYRGQRLSDGQDIVRSEGMRM